MKCQKYFFFYFIFNGLTAINRINNIMQRSNKKKRTAVYFIIIIDWYVQMRKIQPCSTNLKKFNNNCMHKK